MTDADLVDFLRRSRAAFISDLVAAGMPEQDAVDVADKELASTFPGGRAAAEHHVCCVVRDGDVVGHVWFGPSSARPDGSWGIWELEIDASQRGRGIGTRAMELVEDDVRRLGGTALGLNVFEHNLGARRLYERLGYEAVSTSLRKEL